MLRFLNSMGNITVKRMGIVCCVSVLVILIAMIAVRRIIPSKTCTYGDTGEVYNNPMMGFAPNADYVEAVGNNTLVYVDVTWRELEPLEGVYDYERIEEDNFLEMWRRLGKKVVFRFMCDEPSDVEHMDIPDWLYEKTGDGTFYDTLYGKGYSPNYANETFIEAHARAIEALGRRYGQDSFFCFIELGSVGHWGEWHVKYDEGIKRLPGEDVLLRYVTPYVSAFPDAKLLMRRPFSYVADLGLGVYNDMTGHEEDTDEWLEWLWDGGTYSEPETPIELTAVQEVWDNAPVGGEFTSSYSMEYMLTENLCKTLELIEKSHMTFIGPKCPIACDEEIRFPDEVSRVKKSLGYRIGVNRCRISYNRITKNAKVLISLKNYGTAPMYKDWKVCLYLMGEDGQIIERYETDIELTKLAGGERTECTVKAAMPGNAMYSDGVPVFFIGIENPDTGQPEVYMDMDSPRRGFCYCLLSGI